LITLGGMAIASTSALIYDWFSDENKQPAVVINTEKAVASTEMETRDKIIVAGMIIAAAYVYFKYIRRK
ncbi:MAG: hypothetical protein ACI4RJ_01420, partial [Alphaproteobacteria bacterium]